MRKVFYAVIDGNNEVISIAGKHGIVKGIFDSKDDATKIAMKYSKDGFRVIPVGIMTVVDRVDESRVEDWNE